MNDRDHDSDRMADAPTIESRKLTLHSLGTRAIVEEAIGWRLQTHVISPRAGLTYLLCLYERADPQRRAAVDKTIGTW